MGAEAGPVGPLVDDGGVGCAGGGEHTWRLTGVHLTLAGADQTYECGACDLVVYAPAVAALGDQRPGLDFTVDDLTPEERSS